MSLGSLNQDRIGMALSIGGKEYCYHTAAVTATSGFKFGLQLEERLVDQIQLQRIYLYTNDLGLKK